MTTVHDLLENADRTLVLSRSRGRPDFLEFLRDTLESYLDQVESLSRQDALSRAVHEERSTIRNLVEALRQVFTTYLQGSPGIAMESGRPGGPRMAYLPITCRTSSPTSREAISF